MTMRFSAISELPDRVDAALLEREREFLALRRRLNRSFALMFLPIASALVAVRFTRRAAPDAIEAIAPAMVLSFAAAGLVLLLNLRRWRCPHCDAAFRLSEAWASAHWVHCPHCGVRLRSTVTRARRESEAFQRFGEVDAEDLRLRLRRQRRLGAVGAGAALVLGSLGFIAAHELGWGEQAPKWIGAGIAGLVTAALALSARCPRCQRGFLSGQDGHCPRCGLHVPRSNVGSASPAPSREITD